MIRTYLAIIAMGLSFALTAQNNDLYKVGLNVGKHSVDNVYVKPSGLQPIYLDNPLKNITKYLRIFHQMEDDYPAISSANGMRGNPRFDAPDSPSNTWGRMKDGADRIRKLKRDGFHIRVSPEVLVNPILLSSDLDEISILPFPSKFWTADQLGTDAAQRRNNAYLWAEKFLEVCSGQNRQFGNEVIIDELELGNEPWGYPNLSGLKSWYGGVIDAYDDYLDGLEVGRDSITLHAPALQATEKPHRWSCCNCYSCDCDCDCNLADNSCSKSGCPDCGGPSGDYIEDHFPSSHSHFNKLSGYNIHPYAFRKGSADLTLCAENSKGEFSNLDTLNKWLRDKGNEKPIYITEVGWDSEKVGELSQAAYTTRTLMLGAAYPWLERIYFYEDVNSGYNVPNDPDDDLIFRNRSKGLYKSSGILYQIEDATFPERYQGGAKPSYKALLQYKNLLEGGRFLKNLGKPMPDTYVYLVEDKDSVKYIAAWQGIEMNRSTTVDSLENYDTFITIPAIPEILGLEIKEIYQIDGTIPNIDPSTLGSDNKGNLLPFSKYVRQNSNNLSLKISPVLRLFKLRIDDGNNGQAIPLSVNTEDTDNKVTLELIRPVENAITIYWDRANDIKQIIPAGGDTRIKVEHVYTSAFGGNVELEDAENITSLKVWGGFDFDICAINEFEQLMVFGALGANKIKGNANCLGALRKLLIMGNSSVSLDLSSIQNNTNINHIAFGETTTVSGTISELAPNLNILTLRSNTLNLTGDLNELGDKISVINLNLGGNNTITGSLSDLPPNVRYVAMKGNIALTYSGNIPSKLKTLDLKSNSNSMLNDSDAKALLIDFSNSAVSNNISKGKLILDWTNFTWDTNDTDIQAAISKLRALDWKIKDSITD